MGGRRPVGRGIDHGPNPAYTLVIAHFGADRAAAVADRCGWGGCGNEGGPGRFIERTTAKTARRRCCLILHFIGHPVAIAIEPRLLQCHNLLDRCLCLAKAAEQTLALAQGREQMIGKVRASGRGISQAVGAGRGDHNPPWCANARCARGKAARIARLDDHVDL